MSSQESPAEGMHVQWSVQAMAPVVWRQRRPIAAAAAGVALITLIINFLLPSYHRASARLLPDIERGRLAALTQAAEVAQIVGVGGPVQDPGRLYPAILTSETVLREAIQTRYPVPGRADSADLVTVFGVEGDSPEENLENAVVRLRELMTVQFDNRTGVVTATLEMREPVLAAAVLNTIIARLDSFMRLKRSTNASEQRRWVETRVRDVRTELRGAEEDLRAFREKNRRLLDSPQLLMEQERYIREVQVKSTILVELIKQLELAKIEEIRNIAIVNVLDPARPPVHRERPRRAMNTLLAFLGTLLGGALLAGVLGTRRAHRPFSAG